MQLIKEADDRAKIKEEKDRKNERKQNKNEKNSYPLGAACIQLPS